MKMHCYEFRVRQIGRLNSYLVVKECGDVELQRGDVLVVSPTIAAAIYQRYHFFLDTPKRVQAENLQNGTYEVKREGERLPNLTIEELAEDRSMASARRMVLCR